MFLFAYLHRYNGKLPTGNCGKLRSKFELKKRKIANALKPSIKYTTKAEIDKVIIPTFSLSINVVVIIKVNALRLNTN